VGGDCGGDGVVAAAAAAAERFGATWAFAVTKAVP
jgi:NAD(P)H-hydrate repair Nnr-like enzyme with NAD(P)H-hydrate epimerase domain